jgi:AcrR family transcriptional regulator
MSNDVEHVTPPRRGRGRPPKISQDRIVEAALELGLDSFSMQSIAEHLGVTAPALYSHVAGREEVLDLVNVALRDRVAAAADPEGTWREWLTAFGRGVRLHLASSVSTLMEDLRVPGPPDRVAVGERGLQLLIDEGLSPAEAAYAVWLVFRVAITAGTEDAWSFAGFLGETEQVLAPGRPVELPATAAVYAALAHTHPRDAFEFDLEVVLAGIAQQIGTR